jgi:hypothetical protein
MLNVTPAAMFIESAIEEMSKEPHSQAERGRCAKELEEASGKGIDISEAPDEAFGDGYYLGLRVAQILQRDGVKL